MAHSFRDVGVSNLLGTGQTSLLPRDSLPYLFIPTYTFFKSAIPTKSCV